MDEQSMDQLLSAHPRQPKRRRRGEDPLDQTKQSRMPHRRNGPAEWRPSRSNEADSGDDDGEEGRDSSPQPQAARRRRVHAPEHVPQDSLSDDQPGTTSRPAKAVSHLGGFGRNKPKAPNTTSSIYRVNNQMVLTARTKTTKLSKPNTPHHPMHPRGGRGGGAGRQAGRQAC